MAKKLLNENTIRRFMKLADMNRLSENFISEMEEEDPVEEAMGGAYLGARDEEELDVPVEEEVPDDTDLDVSVEEEVPEEGREELARKAVEAVAVALDVEIEIEGGGGEELPAEEGELAPPEEELAPPEEELAPPEEDLMEKVLKTLDEADIEIVDDVQLKEALIKRVVARVAKRILAEKF
tara:strand:+ start:9168 stop:9710 length:543 start_codon:yes stop_codon:yes gene_type:complete